MPRISMKESLEGIAFDGKPKVITRNTFQYTQNGARIVRLHHTDIVTFLPNDKIVLNSGGWKTMTTKDRMNAALKEYHVFSKRGVWYVRPGKLWSEHGGVEVPYYDGMILPDAFEPKAMAKAEKAAGKEIALKKKIKDFVAKTIPTKGPLPQPSSGDCWFCCMCDKSGKPWGDLSCDNEHLLNHVKEGYMHGSLIVNALRYCGMGDMGIAMTLSGHFNIALTRARIRRYLGRKLGLAV